MCHGICWNQKLGNRIIRGKGAGGTFDVDDSLMPSGGKHKSTPTQNRHQHSSPPTSFPNMG